jgi:hypothetical protein
MADPTQTSAGATTTPRATALYVFGVIPAADAAGWAGADGIDGVAAEVRPIKDGGLAALVSDIPGDRVPGRREDLESHRRVLARAIEHGTVIPMRFGMVMDTEDLVRERLLVKHAPELADLLRTLAGQVQMTIRAFYAEDALLRHVMETNEGIAKRSAELEGLPELATRAERIALGEAVAAAIDARRARDEQALLDRLNPFASDVRVDAPGGDRVALNAHLLVPRDRRIALDGAVRELGSALQGYLALRYIGPLPAYSFSELSLESGEG